MSQIKGIRQFIRFGLVGVGNTLIDFTVLNLLIWFFQAPQGERLLLCNVIGFACANLNSYCLNKRWTFRDRQKATVSQYGTFLWVSLVGLAVNTFFLWLFTDLLAPASLTGKILWVNFAKLIASVASLTWNFLAYRSLVFQEDRLHRSISGVRDCYAEKE